MKKRDERSITSRFALKLAVLLIPFIIILGIYLHDDPFMVLKQYKEYNSTVVLDEDYVGWQIFVNNRSKIAFNSFIMGNSCTMAFQCHEWEKHLKAGKAIRLPGCAESIMSIYKKLAALDKLGAPINNILMIIDKTSLENCQLSLSHTGILPHTISGISKFKFQEMFCQSFFYPSFLIPYLDYKITHKYRPYMNGVINPYGRIRESDNNDAINPREKMIEEEGEKYWINREHEFQKKRDKNYRDGKYKEDFPVLYENQINILTKIKDILVRNNSSIKIIISPDYNQVSINKKDIEVLNNIFGENNVFDFTGINEYTNDIHNYYEKTHYRPILGERLMNKIYK